MVLDTVRQGGVGDQHTVLPLRRHRLTRYATAVVPMHQLSSCVHVSSSTHAASVAGILILSLAAVGFVK